MVDLEGTAAFSDCGKYRYRLTRRLPQVVRWVRPCLFIMLNPSTADADKDDATIRRCIGFADQWLSTKMTVVNLFGLRATDPKELLAAEDPEGEADGWIEDEVEKHRHTGIIVAAWGFHPIAARRGEYIHNHYGPFRCLGKTKNGSPRHPLYVRKDKELEAWP